MSDEQQLDDDQAGAKAQAEASAATGPGGSGRGRLARAALLTGYGAAAVVTTAMIQGWEPKVPKLVGD